MSPGTIRIRKKMITATPNRVGIIRSSRLTMYLVTPPRPLLAQPHAVELVVDEVAGRDGPAAEPDAVRDDPVPLQRVRVVGFFVQQPALELADPLLPLLVVERAALLLIEIVQGSVDVAAVVVAADVHRLELVEVEVGIDRVAALRVDGDLVVALAQVGLPLLRLDEVVPRLQSDLPPLIHEPDGNRLVGHGDVPILQAEREALGDAGFLQETARLGPRLRDVRRVAGELLELCRRRRVARARELDAADALHYRDLGERLRALVPVEGQGEGPARAPVTPRLPLVIHADQEHAIPRALLHRHLRAERLHDAVALRRREAAELDVGPLAADRRHLGAAVLDHQRAIAVEVRLALVPVVGVLLAGPVGALHVLDEDEPQLLGQG